MLSSKSQQWLKGRTTSGDLKISVPRFQPRNSNSISLGRSSRHQYIWKNPQGDSSRRPRGIIKSQFSPWYCQMRGELWAGVFWTPHLCSFREWILRSSTVTPNRSRILLGPVLVLRLISWETSWPISAWVLGSLCCGLRLTESSFQEKWGSRRRIHPWTLMLRYSGCAEDSAERNEGD